MCNQIIQDRDADNEIRSNAYAVLGFLEGYASLENIRCKAIISIEKAVKLQPSDWRLHAMLATRHCAVGNSLQSLECIGRSMELTADSYSKFTLGLRMGKILFNMNRHEETIAAFNDVLLLYDTSLKDHPKMTDKALGRLAVGEYMLVTAYGMQGRSDKAVNHYRDAEKKRNAIDKRVAEKSIGLAECLQQHSSSRRAQGLFRTESAIIAGKLLTILSNGVIAKR